MDLLINGYAGNGLVVVVIVGVIRVVHRGTVRRNACGPDADGEL